MNFKKIIALILVIAVCCSIAVGLTMAYMTDEDKATNVMVVGNIDIEQREHDRNGNDFVQGQTLLPIVYNASEKDANGYPKANNYIDKIVTVKNTGKNDAYVRTFIAIPVYAYEGYDPTNASTSVLHWNGYSYGDAAPDYPIATWLPAEKIGVNNYWHWGKEGTENYWPGNTNGWNMFTTEINGQLYEVYVVTHVEPLEAGQITAPNLTGVYLDSRVDFNGTNYIIGDEPISNFDGSVEVLVATQAVQWDPAWDVWTALDAAFGAPSATNHPWMNDTTMVTVDTVDELRDALTSAEPGTIIDANGADLGDVDDVTFADGVTVMNATFSGASNYGQNANGTVTFINCTFASTDSYAAHFDGGNGELVFINCKFAGWNSFGAVITGLTFENCYFGHNGNYGVVRVYQNATFTDCVFDNAFEWADTNVTGTNVSFNDCTGITAAKIFNNEEKAGNWFIDGVDVSSQITTH